MLTLGTFEAKTTFSALLDRVAAGEDIIITRHGKPVARLTHSGLADTNRLRDAHARLIALRTRTAITAQLREKIGV
jgi:prevent-host-death family protein